MTAINIRVSRAQIQIASDSMITCKDARGSSTKIYPLIGHRTVVAGMGHVSIIQSFILEVASSIEHSDFESIASWSAPLLRRLTPRRGHSATVFIAGVRRNGLLRALRLDSQFDYTRLMLCPGLHLHPFPRVEAARAALKAGPVGAITFQELECPEGIGGPRQVATLRKNGSITQRLVPVEQTSLSGTAKLP